MTIGLNFPYPWEWSRTRFFRNAYHQMEPWWTGIWSARDYMRGSGRRTIRSAMGPRMIPGSYHGSTASLRGDVRVMGNYADIGSDNVWLEKDGGSAHDRVGLLFHRSDWSDGEVILPKEGLLRDDIVETITCAGTIRLMDWCAPGSGLKSIDQLQRSGESCRAIPLEAPEHGLNAECGVHPSFVHEVAKHAKRIWLNPPLLVCSDPSQFIRWCERFIPPDCEVFISPGNELWNMDTRFPASHLLWGQARVAYPNEDTHLAMAHLSLKLASQMKRLLAPLAPRVTVVWEWWAAHIWAINGERQMCRHNLELLREIGHAAVSCYCGHDASDERSLTGSMEDPLDNIEMWGDDAELNNFTLHAYEIGAELPDQHRAVVAGAPYYPAKMKEFANAVRHRVSPEGVVCWYEPEMPGSPAWNAIHNWMEIA